MHTSYNSLSAITSILFSRSRFMFFCLYYSLKTRRFLIKYCSVVLLKVSIFHFSCLLNLNDKCVATQHKSIGCYSSNARFLFQCKVLSISQFFRICFSRFFFCSWLACIQLLFFCIYISADLTSLNKFVTVLQWRCLERTPLFSSAGKHPFSLHSQFSRSLFLLVVFIAGWALKKGWNFVQVSLKCYLIGFSIFAFILGILLLD